jgi:hypothetical protein
MKRLLILPFVAVMLQGGCVAGDQAVPNVQYKPVAVDHPVPCVPADKKPVMPLPLGSRPADARQASALLLAKVREWEGYGDHAQPLLDACTKLP